MDQIPKQHNSAAHAERFRAPGAMVFLGTTLVIWLLMGRDAIQQIALLDGEGSGVLGEGTAGARQIFFCLSPSIEAFFTSHLLHVDGLHLTLTVFVVLGVGGLLETRWGTPRFLLFYAWIVVMTTAVTWGSAWICARLGVFGETVSGTNITPIAFGASGLALACLVTWASVVRDRLVFGWLGIRRLIWSGVFLGVAGLALLDTLSASSEYRLFLLPQLSAVIFALVWIHLDPICERKIGEWHDARERRERVRVGEIRHRVEELLEKISTDGYESLSPDEKSFLRHASKHFKRD